jgi:hypothetical protein
LDSTGTLCLKKYIERSKKMKKTFLAVILLAVVAVTTVIAQESARNFQYDLNEAKNGVVINKYIGSNTNLVIPRTIEGYPVVEIGSLYGDGDRIAPDNFLVSLVIPEGVRIIGRNAFNSQKNLTSVTLPSTLIYIGISAFYKTGLRTVRIPDSVVEIDWYAFSDNSNLTDVNIPTGIKTIGKGAFSACSRLSNVTIPAGIKSIDWDRYDGFTRAFQPHIGFEGCALTIAARQRLTQLGYDKVQDGWYISEVRVVDFERDDLVNGIHVQVQADYYNTALMYYNMGNYYAGRGEVGLARWNYGNAGEIMNEAFKDSGRRVNQDLRTLDAEYKKKMEEFIKKWS